MLGVLVNQDSIAVFAHCNPVWLGVPSHVYPPHNLFVAHIALQVLNWNSHNMDDFLFEAMQLVKEVDGVLKAIQDNVAKTRAILAQWQKDLMFDRKDGRVGSEEVQGWGMLKLLMLHGS